MDSRLFTYLLCLVFFTAECTEVLSLEFVTSATFATFDRSVAWCSCDYLAVGGQTGLDGLAQVFHFDQINRELEAIGNFVVFDNNVNSVSWCPGCRFLAAGGGDGIFVGQVQVYGFDPANPSTLQQIGSPTLFGLIVNSVDWCPSCRFLAVSGRTGLFISSSTIQVFSFDPSNPGSLVPIGIPYTNTNNHSEFLEVKWCPDCRYLAVAQGPIVRNVSIFSFDPEAPTTLVLTTSFAHDINAVTLDWCQDCNFIAVGGRTLSNDPTISIYRFDSEDPTSVSLVSSISVDPSSGTINSLRWCGCNNLAVVWQKYTTPVQSALQLYHLDDAMTFSLLQTIPLSGIPYSVSWCGGCDYLAVSYDAKVDVYKAHKRPEAPTLLAQKIFHRFPTQLDIINKLCWDAVDFATTYNVYADAALSTLLAIITSAPFCYSQHQICRGKSTTYYVTAVDANGNESGPASVTI